MSLAGQSTLALGWMKAAAKSDGLDKGRLEAGNPERLVLWGEQRPRDEAGGTTVGSREGRDILETNHQDWAVV